MHAQTLFFKHTWHWHYVTGIFLRASFSLIISFIFSWIIPSLLPCCTLWLIRLNTVDVVDSVREVWRVRRKHLPPGADRPGSSERLWPSRGFSQFQLFHGPAHAYSSLGIWPDAALGPSVVQRASQQIFYKPELIKQVVSIYDSFEWFAIFQCSKISVSTAFHLGTEYKYIQF